MKFPKRLVTLDCSTDLGMSDQYLGVEFTVWDDPSRSVTRDLLVGLGGGHDDETDEEVAERGKKFAEALARYVDSCNIDGVSFETSDDVYHAFEHPDLPLGWTYEVCVMLVSRLINGADYLKKASGASEEMPSSGDDSEKKEEK